MTSPTERFSSRVENYIKYRPGYPPGVVELLKQECGLSAASVVADIGSGTGLLAELLLKEQARVYGVEPNREMREAGERLLRDYERFTSVEGTAEATTLEDASINLVTAGQAFHWFRMTEARREFVRILKPGGAVALIWNERRLDSTPFLAAYERLLMTYGTDYETVRQQQVAPAVIAEFFSPGEFRTRRLDNRQVFDFAALRGRLLSSSYTPEAGQPRHDEMLEALRALFDQHAEQGQVVFEYDTHVYYGQLPPA